MRNNHEVTKHTKDLDSFVSFVRFVVEILRGLKAPHRTILPHGGRPDLSAEA